MQRMTKHQTIHIKGYAVATGIYIYTYRIFQLNNYSTCQKNGSKNVPFHFLKRLLPYGSIVDNDNHSAPFCPILRQVLCCSFCFVSFHFFSFRYVYAQYIPIAEALDTLDAIF